MEWTGEPEPPPGVPERLAAVQEQLLGRLYAWFAATAGVELAGEAATAAAAAPPVCTQPLNLAPGPQDAVHAVAFVTPFLGGGGGEDREFRQLVDFLDELRSTLADHAVGIVLVLTDLVGCAATAADATHSAGRAARCRQAFAAAAGASLDEVVVLDDSRGSETARRVLGREAHPGAGETVGQEAELLAGVVLLPDRVASLLRALQAAALPFFEQRGFQLDGAAVQPELPMAMPVAVAAVGSVKGLPAGGQGRRNQSTGDGGGAAEAAAAARLERLGSNSDASADKPS